MKVKSLFLFIYFTFIGAALLFVVPTMTDKVTSGQIGEFFGVIGMGFGLTPIVMICVIFRHIKITQNVNLLESEFK